MSLSKQWVCLGSSFFVNQWLECPVASERSGRVRYVDMPEAARVGVLCLMLGCRVCGWREGVGGPGSIGRRAIWGRVRLTAVAVAKQEPKSPPTRSLSRGAVPGTSGFCCAPGGRRNECASPPNGMRRVHAISRDLPCGGMSVHGLVLISLPLCPCADACSGLPQMDRRVSAGADRVVPVCSRIRNSNE